MGFEGEGVEKETGEGSWWAQFQDQGAIVVGSHVRIGAGVWHTLALASAVSNLEPTPIIRHDGSCWGGSEGILWILF